LPFDPSSVLKVEYGLEQGLDCMHNSITTGDCRRSDKCCSRGVFSDLAMTPTEARDGGFDYAHAFASRSDRDKPLPERRRFVSRRIHIPVQLGVVTFEYGRPNRTSSRRLAVNLNGVVDEERAEARRDRCQGRSERKRDPFHPMPVDSTPISHEQK
jgi:hypothetical protein